MDGKTHKIGGICAGVICAEMVTGLDFSTPQHTIANGLILSASIFGAYLPDIDSETSTISRKLPITSFILNLFVGHRGIMHTFVPYTIVLIPIELLAFILTIPFSGIKQFTHMSLFGIVTMLVVGTISGVLSHFLLDIITPMGLPILYPITKKRFSIAKIKSKFNPLVIIVIVFLTFLIVGRMHTNSWDFVIVVFNKTKVWFNELMNKMDGSSLEKIN